MSTGTTAVPQTSTWKIDPAHTEAEFKVRHMMVSNVKGHFSGIAGSATINESDITKSSVEATIEVGTINTREPQRDADLKSENFLHAEKFPSLSFKSTGIARKGADGLEVTGDLTIRGVTRSVVFAVDGPTAPVKDPWGNTRVGLSATTKISRKDYGLNWNAVLEAGGVVVGDEVAITLEVEFLKAQ
jgi:polyisoprenoid-binding protein YceI